MANDLEVFEKNVQAIFEDMAELLISKRKSYGPSNLVEYGAYGILVRMSDKVSRLRTMYKSGTQANADGDSKFDAWKDIIGYATLAILMELEEAAEMRREQIENPPPGVSYVSIPLPSTPIPGPYSVGEWETPSESKIEIKYVRDPESPGHPLPEPGSHIVLYQCLNCGRVALSMDRMAYDCHPFVKAFVTEVTKWEAS